MGIYNGKRVARAIVNPHTDLPRVFYRAGEVKHEINLQTHQRMQTL